MKKVLSIFCILVFLFCLPLTFSACTKSERSNVLTTDKVDKITLHINRFNTDYEFTAEELAKLIPLLQSQPQLEKESASVNIVNIRKTKATNVLTVVTSKTFFKKSRTFNIDFGREVVIKSKINDYIVSDTVEADYIGKENYGGTATDDLITFLAPIIEREEARIVDEFYNAMMLTLQERGYNVVPVEDAAQVSYLPLRYARGFYAENNNNVNDNVIIIQLDSFDAAESFAAIDGGQHAYCFSYNGSSDANSIVREALGLPSVF